MAVLQRSAQPRRRGSRHAGQAPAWLIRTITIAVFAAAWELVGRNTDPLLFSPLSKVLVALVDIVRSGELLRSILLSGQALIYGYGLAVLIGVPLGLLIGRFASLYDLASPYLNALLTTPMIGVAPLLLFAFGIGVASRAAVVFVFAIVVITINTAAGMLHVSRGLVDMSRVFGASQLQQFRFVHLPSALPATFAGLRLGLGQAMTGMITAEFIVTAVGIGKQLMFYSARFRSDYLLATLLAVIVLATLIMGLLEWLRKRFAWSS